MLESKETQFSLSPEGQILWQEKVNSPLPGVAVAKLEKGDHPLSPNIVILKTDETEKHDEASVKNHIKLWFKTHLKNILEPLVLLETPQGTEEKADAVSQIAKKVYDGLGIIPREDIEHIIAELTPETRTDLRAKRIRLGPILAFIPILKKPAAVKLRALLWSLYNDAPLPAKTPADGIVSARIEDENPNEEFYRAISYPLYGGRAVRIDMLDRVISCVYDHSDKGKFQARHEMAEWLGCTIEDLYKVLEAMGHKKIYDPADHIAHEEEGTEETNTKKTEGENNQPAEDEKTTETQSEQSEEKPKNIEKPELATFRLKKGKAFQKAGSKRPEKPGKPAGANKKKKETTKKKQPKRKDTGPRIISVEAKTKEEDSPFAILQQLK